MKAAGTKAKRSIIASCTVYGSSTRITCASTIATHRNTVPGGALKIGWRSAGRGLRIGEGESIRPRWGRCLLAGNSGDRPRGKQDGASSEERRVGKEGVSKCRSRWSQYH